MEKTCLQKWEDRDRIKIETNNAKNDLESYIFYIKEKLYEENVIEMSTESERDELNGKVQESSEWLETEGESNTLDEYKKQKSSLESHAKKIFFRVKEANARPESAINCLASINITREILPSIFDKRQVTEEEKTGLLKSCIEIEQWLESMLKLQESTQPYEDPLVTSSMIDQKCNIISVQLNIFSKRSIRPKEKKESTTKPKEGDKSKDQSPPNEEKIPNTEGDQSSQSNQEEPSKKIIKSR